MTTTQEAPLNLGRKVMLAALFCAVVAMFAGSFWYRLQGGGLTVAVREQPDSMGDPMRAMMGVDVDQLRALVKSAQAHPDDPKAQLALGNAFIMMQAWDEAMKPLLKAEKASPGNPDVERALGAVQFQRKNYEQARRAFSLALAKKPNDATTQYNLGVVLKHYLNRPAEGDAHFRKVLAIGVGDPDVIKGARDELAAPVKK